MSLKRNSSATTEVKAIFLRNPQAVVKSRTSLRSRDLAHSRKCSIDKVCALITNASPKFIRSNKNEKNCAQSLISSRRISRQCTIGKSGIQKILFQFSTNLKGIRT